MQKRQTESLALRRSAGFQARSLSVQTSGIAVVGAVLARTHPLADRNTAVYQRM
jgi:hypothetical protein